MSVVEGARHPEPVKEEESLSYLDPDPKTLTREEKIAMIDKLRIQVGLDPEPSAEEGSAKSGDKLAIAGTRDT